MARTGVLSRKELDAGAEALLVGAHLKKTPGRLGLLRALLAAERPMSHQEIMAETGLTRVSVYRALESFHEAGLIHRIEAGDRLWRFAVCGHEHLHGEHCHPHFTCRNCGEVKCFESIDMPRASGAPAGYRIETQEVYLRGLCARCSGKVA